MKTIRFTQIADERFSETRQSLGDRVIQTRDALRIRSDKHPTGDKFCWVKFLKD